MKNVFFYGELKETINIEDNAEIDDWRRHYTINLDRTAAS